MSAWTQDERTTAITDFKSGLSHQKIADKLGRTRNAVVGELYRLGITRKGGCEPAIKIKLQKVTPTKVVPTFVDTSEFICDNPHEEPTIYSKPLLETSDLLTECRYIINSGMLCCGHPVEEGRPYCARHCRISYRPLSA